MHTAFLHWIRRLTKLPYNEDCTSLGQHVREDDDALPCLEPVASLPDLLPHPLRLRDCWPSRSASSANAQKKYDPGATDTEIKIGNIMPYSGPASAYATIGKTEAAYFNKINSEGGINGRKINFISYDDGYSPPKTVEQARKLVESDEVLLIFNPLGTPGNTAIQKYMNAKKVPQIFVSSGAAKWNDPKNFPWTIGWQPNYQTEARIYAAYILKNYPGKTIGVLYQNDDFGKDYVIGLREGLGDQANKLIVDRDRPTRPPRRRWIRRSSRSRAPTPTSS